MELKLKNPIAFFDLETTGINIAKDRIIEIAILKIDPSGKEDHLSIRVNPTIPIDPKASEIHGIYDEDVEDAPTPQDRIPSPAGCCANSLQRLGLRRCRGRSQCRWGGRLLRPGSSCPELAEP